MIVVALRDPAPDDPAPDEHRVLRMRWVKTPHGLRARWELTADDDDFWVPGREVTESPWLRFRSPGSVVDGPADRPARRSFGRGF